MSQISFFLGSLLFAAVVHAAPTVPASALAAYEEAKQQDVADNSEKAFELYQIAAEAGIPEAIHDLAFCYLDGFGVAKDRHKGMILMQESAHCGYPKAMTALAIFFQRQGNSANSLYWQTRAAQVPLGNDPEWNEIIVKARKVFYGILSDTGSIFTKAARTMDLNTPIILVSNIQLDHAAQSATPAGVISLKR